MNKYGYSGDPRFKPVSAWGYLGYTVLFCIPVIGLLLLIVFAFSKKNINRRNFARSFFCALLITILVTVALVATGALGKGKWLQSLLSDGNPITSQINSIINLVLPGGISGTQTDWTAGETVTAEINGKSIQVHQRFKKTMDEYKSAYDEYIKLAENPSTLQYFKMLARFGSVSQAIDAIDETQLSDGDYAYYVYIMSQINRNLIRAAK